MKKESSFWALSESALLQQLNTSPQGLEPVEASKRLTEFGPNSLGEEKKTSFLSRLAAQFKSPVVITLIAACVVSAMLDEIVDAIAIGAILVINAIIGYLQESKAEQAVAALKRMAAPHARVLRSGQVVDVASTAICPGDVLALEAGDFVPADARILLANQMSANEASLTGESLPVKKQVDVLSGSTPLADRTNMLFAGTAVAAGSGRAVVVATGMQTELGKIAALLAAKKVEDTPLQHRLRVVSNRLLLFAGIVTVLIAVLGLMHREPWLEVLMRAISLAVAAIPEGLPTVVTLTLALAIRRMASKKAIVRHLPAVETLGTTDVICTDKTGTLTTGEMQVREVYYGGAVLPVREGDDVAGELWRAATLCSNATVGPNGENPTGDTTEIAILRGAQRTGMNLAATISSHRRVFEWPFDSDRKRMSVAVDAAGEYRIFVKGAPESVLPRCSLKEEERQRVVAALESLSNQGRRVLAVAQRVVASQQKESLFNEQASEAAESDLVFLGLLALADPPRQEAMNAIAECKAAGIAVVMITGDHPTTAKAIAKELGIVEPGKFEGVVTGTELDQLSDEQLARMVKSTAVYARVSPEHKLRIVRAWKSHGLVVAMTGDGVNDAPGLKEASIGVSMGRGGTEVARQASAMILSDDNFATIVTAVKEGRGVHGNIQRTINYLLTGNMAEILVMLGAAVAGWPAPLLPLHLLWINLVTDGLPTLALAAEPVPKDALKHKPTNTLGRSFYARIFTNGAIEAVLVLAVYYWFLRTTDEISARTMAFSMLVFSELFRSFTSRNDYQTFLEIGPFGNWYHAAAVAFPLGFQFLLHHSDTFRELFRVRTLNWTECLVLVGLSLIPATVIEVHKLATRRHRR